MLAVPGSPPVSVSAAGGQGQGESDDWEWAALVARPSETSSKATILMVLMASVPSSSLTPGRGAGGSVQVRRTRGSSRRTGDRRRRTGDCRTLSFEQDGDRA